MDRGQVGNVGSMHQLGYELPERQGFGGLWEAVAEAAEGTHKTAGEVESEPEVVAHSEGPASPRTRRAIERFRAVCCDVEVDAPSVAAA